MSSPAPKTSTQTPLVAALEQLGPHDHFCSIYESPEEHYAVAIPFMRIGLDRGEKCIYIADDGTVGDVRQAMESEGIDVDRASASKALVLATKEQAYLEHGSFHPDWMFTFWKEATQLAMSEGFSAVRATGETEWVLRGGRGLERWMEYESQLTHTLSESNCSALCQYNRRLFPPELILDVIRTHPVVVYRGTVCRNLYYVPPEEFLGTNQTAREVERLLTNIREREHVEDALREQLTERKRAEEELRRSEAYLADGQRISHTGSWGWNVGTGELFWSREHFRIFGLDPETAPPSYAMVLEGIHPDDRPLVEQTVDRAVRERTEFEVNCRVVLADESIKYVQSLGHPVISESGDPIEFVGTLIDVTERRRAEEALREAQAELAHVTRVMTMGELAASIAHEINQPLAALVTNGGVCLRWLAREPPNLDEAREAARRIIRDGNRANEVISRIRALMRKTDMATARVDINEVIEEVILLTRNETTRRGVTVRMELAADLPPVSGDRVQLQQLTLNLLMNGIEAMASVNDRPRELIICSRTNESGQVLVAVQDCGMGIAGEDLEKIFDAFYTTKSQGMGMGLAISRSIIEAHGGRLWATPNDGAGATIQFTLPLSAPANEA
ncbi:MAG TPA: MEDS domain-containing protein [Blastocatellia bacterium]|nr:MEDS domain-containing protein [Blastocatellia bacterium]